MMRKQLVLAGLCVCLLVWSPLSSAQRPAKQNKGSFAGAWKTNYGPLMLVQEGNKVRGTYYDDGSGKLEGTVTGNKLTFTYSEPGGKGAGYLELSADQKSLVGKYHLEGQAANQFDWTGELLLNVPVPAQGGKPGPFTGSWKTTYGTVVLVQTGDKVKGSYDDGAATIDGVVVGNKLTFKYKEMEVSGEGYFELAADQKSFAGKLRTSTDETLYDWTGDRVQTVVEQPPVPAAKPGTFAGTWKTNWGPVLLTQEGNKVRGTYNEGAATIAGTVAGNKLTARFKENTVEGDILFDLSADGKAMAGKWRYDNSPDSWGVWTAERELLAQPAPAAKPAVFAGSWKTTFGTMTLTQEGNRVRGFYLLPGEGRCTVEGTVAGKTLTFRYQEPSVAGEGEFTLGADGKSFTGKWRPAGATEWSEWTGSRAAGEAPMSFNGLWQTSYGRMRLIESGDKISGIYSSGGASTVAGKRTGNRFTFEYKEATVVGEGWFELSADGQRFEGKWRPKGQASWADWTGERLNPVPGRKWLIVLEANWESSLAEQEYAFGAMLRAFFARSSDVQVRHRFFNTQEGLKRWCEEVAFLAEPVVLVLATHGTPEGVPVGGGIMGATQLAEALRYGGNIQLLHFSACLLMKDRFATDLVKALEGKASFPISGYRTSVDWAASAIVEFGYFEMILLRGHSVEKAADRLVKTMPFAGDKVEPGSVFPAAGFRVLLPSKPVVADR